MGLVSMDLSIWIRWSQPGSQCSRYTVHRQLDRLISSSQIATDRQIDSQWTSQYGSDGPSQGASAPGIQFIDRQIVRQQIHLHRQHQIDRQSMDLMVLAREPVLQVYSSQIERQIDIQFIVRQIANRLLYMDLMVLAREPVLQVYCSQTHRYTIHILYRYIQIDSQ